MNARTEEDMDRIFASFHEDRLSAAPRPLASWVTDHPDLSTCFVQWATETPALAAADLRPASPDFEARSLAIGQGILMRLGLTPQDRSALSSLNDAARNSGKRPRELAQALGLGMTLFAKLNRRLIHAATIPERLIERLSAELNVTLDDIRGYLAQPPSLAEGAAYRSESTPEATDAQDFAEAVRASADMSDEQKREWMND